MKICIYITESVYSTPETIVNQLYFNFFLKGKKIWFVITKKIKLFPLLFSLIH